MQRAQLLLRYSFVVLLFAVAPLSAPAAGEASRFIEERAHSVLEMFNERSLSPEQREARLNDLVTKSFDVPTISRFVLGRYWVSMPQVQREEFAKVFEHYMVHIYASRFSRYPDAKVKLAGEHEEAGGRVAVHTRIQWRGSQEPAKIDWWVKQSQDGYKIIDVNIEGVSQLVTLRDEFSAVISQHDDQVAGLIDHLKEKTGS